MTGSDDYFSAMSKEELAQENDRITAEICRLKAGLEEMTLMFQNMEKAFVESKASFSLSRYGELKDMIKRITSDESMEKVGTAPDSLKSLKSPNRFEDCLWLL